MIELLNKYCRIGQNIKEVFSRVEDVSALVIKVDGLHL
jgi:hypothetical protein